MNDGNKGDNNGHVRVHRYDNETKTWSQLGSDIDGQAAKDELGASVSLSGDGKTIAIGAPRNGSGYVAIYKFDDYAFEWVPLGAVLKGENSGDKFGKSVSMAKHGDVVAIGAYLNDNNGMNSGSVAIFSYRKDVTAWQPLGTAINGDCISEFLGRSVSLSDDGQFVAVGAGCYVSNERAGHTRIYAYNSSVSDWVQMGEDIAEEANYDRSGTSVSLSADGKIVAIGASSNDGNGNNSGHGRMFKYDGSAWSQIGDDIDGKSAWDLFGQSVSLLGDGLTVAFGASGGDKGGRVLMYKYAPA